MGHCRLCPILFNLLPLTAAVGSFRLGSRSLRSARRPAAHSPAQSHLPAVRVRPALPRLPHRRPPVARDGFLRGPTLTSYPRPDCSFHIPLRSRSHLQRFATQGNRARSLLAPQTISGYTHPFRCYPYILPPVASSQDKPAEFPTPLPVFRELPASACTC